MASTQGLRLELSLRISVPALSGSIRLATYSSFLPTGLELPVSWMCIHLVDHKAVAPGRLSMTIIHLIISDVIMFHIHSVSMYVT